MGISNDPFGGHVTASPISLIEVNGAYLEVNTPKATKSVVDGSGGSEYAQGLPPYARTTVFRTREVLNAPKDWGRGDSDFCVPVKPGTGMWLDLNRNFDSSHDVAVMLSMQGINALTRESMLGAQGLSMKKTPEQNYLATTGTPYGLFWLDGFKTEEGVTRQFYFTDDASKGVAAHVLQGKQTHSFGLLFFKSKHPKPRPKGVYRGSLESSSLEYASSGDDGFTLECLSLERSAARSLEVGAGAKIRQHVYSDPRTLDYWEPAPFAKIVLYFYPEAELPPRDSLQASGIPVGNL